MIELLTDPQAWAALVTLTAMEIILGLPNSARHEALDLPAKKVEILNAPRGSGG